MQDVKDVTYKPRKPAVLSAVRWAASISPPVICDPNSLQWIAGIAQPITTVMALIAVAFAARSARAASRSAAIADRGLQAQTRPLLSDMPREHYTDQEREVVLPGGRSRQVALSGAILVDDDEGWLSMPVRNAGRGMAQIERVDVDLAGASERPVKRAAGPSRRHVQPDGEIRLHVEPGRASLEFETFRGALAQGAGIILQVVYTDFAGQQRHTTFFHLERRAGAPWRAIDVWTIAGEPDT